MEPALLMRASLRPVVALLSTTVVFAATAGSWGQAAAASPPATAAASRSSAASVVSTDDIARAQQLMADMQAKVQRVGQELQAGTARWEAGQAHLRDLQRRAVATRRAAEQAAGATTQARARLGVLASAQFRSPVPDQIVVAVASRGGGFRDALLAQADLQQAQGDGEDALRVVTADRVRADGLQRLAVQLQDEAVRTEQQLAADVAALKALANRTNDELQAADRQVQQLQAKRRAQLAELARLARERAARLAAARAAAAVRAAAIHAAAVRAAAIHAAEVRAAAARAAAAREAAQAAAQARAARSAAARAAAARAVRAAQARSAAAAAAVQAAPVQAAPVQAAPVQAAPVQAAPVQAAPVQAAPVQAAPVRAAPPRVVRIRAARSGSQPSSVPSCSGSSTGGYANGFLDPAALCPLYAAPGHRLRADAAAAFNAMSRARAAATGSPLCVTDSYRSYAEQVDVYSRKPSLAATPGTSNHGLGLAADLCGGVERFGSSAYLWMKANAGRFGFSHPSWAEPGGAKPEPWHWEFGG